MSRYSGPVLDGPWQGKSYEGTLKSFTIAFCPPAPLVGPDEYTDGVTEIKHGTYEWHPVRSAWVWKGAIT